MFRIKNLLFTLLLTTILTGFAAAQPPPSAPSINGGSTSGVQNKQNFISLDGGFSVALPQQISGFEGTRPVPHVNKGGSNFTWRVSQGFFSIGYVDRIFSPEESKQVLQNSVDGLIKNITDGGGTLISKKEISLDGYSGAEIKLKIQEGVVACTRYFLVKDRLYILSTGWRSDEDGSTQLKIFDTFKLIDRKSAIARKIEEATPEDLPQSPIAKKLKTDVQDEGLKGKVKSVIETDEDLGGTRSVGGIKMSSEDFYDKNGNQTKHIYYDYRGNPSSVTVYGFIDKMRVSKYGRSISYEYNPPAAAPAPAGAVPNAEKPKPVDSRYSTKFEYKYDDKGRLTEIVRYRNDGEMSGKTVYIYDGNKRDETNYDDGGKITSRLIEVLDEKGNVIEKTFISQTSKYPDSRYAYAYQTFDDKGNWTKRTVTGKSGVYNGGFKDVSYIEYRDITYYQ